MLAQWEVIEFSTTNWSGIASIMPYRCVSPWGSGHHSNGIPLFTSLPCPCFFFGLWWCFRLELHVWLPFRKACTNREGKAQRTDSDTLTSDQSPAATSAALRPFCSRPFEIYLSIWCRTDANNQGRRCTFYIVACSVLWTLYDFMSYSKTWPVSFCHTE